MPSLLWLLYHGRTMETSGGRNDEKNRMSVIASSRLILEGAVLQSKGIGNRFVDLKREVLGNARTDNVYNTMVTDELIMAFGSILLRKLGPGRANDITQRMRQLTRLLLVLNDRSGKRSEELSSYISPDCFDDVINATEELCSLFISKDGRRTFQSPSLALRLGHLLNKITDVKLGVSMRTKDTVSKTESEDFRALMKAEWTDTISSNALNTLKRKKDQEILLLPLTDDLTKMKDFLVREINYLCIELQSNLSYRIWRKLAQFVMTRLILFNKRRGGEVSRLLLETYLQKPNWRDSANKELLSSLNPLEKQLIKRMDLLQIPGKKNRKVPLLLNEEVKNGMEMLVNRRGQCSIPFENPYFFASRSSGGYLESCHAISLAANSAELKDPQLVTLTRLRKYNATVCQVVDLSPVETEWLSNHMGHSLNIHKNFYRLHDSVIELAKVSRVLMAVDNGEISKFQGKKLEDINVNELKIDKVGERESDDECEPDVDDAVCDTELADGQQVNSRLLIQSNEKEHHLLDLSSSVKKIQVGSLPKPQNHNYHKGQRRKRPDLEKVVDLSPVETEWLSNHMGHSLNIHKNFYRLHDSVIELAKVSRVLMAVDNGEISKFQGKKLEDINVNELKIDKVGERESDDECEPDVDDAVCDTELADGQQVNSRLLIQSNEKEHHLLDLSSSVKKIQVGSLPKPQNHNYHKGQRRKRPDLEKSPQIGSTTSPQDSLMSYNEEEATGHSSINSAMSKMTGLETDDDDCIQFVRRKRRRISVIESSSDEDDCPDDICV